mgnify:CR=1 FL=1
METITLFDIATFGRLVRYQVPRYSGWKHDLPGFLGDTPIWRSDTKYRDIADGNFVARGCDLLAIVVSDTKYRDIADGNHLLSNCISDRI